MLMTDGATGIDRWLLSQLSSHLWGSRRGEEAISTTDSGPGRAPARHKERRIQPKAHEETKVTDRPVSDVNALPCLPTVDTCLQSGSRLVGTEAAQNEIPTNKKTHAAAAAAAERNESANISHVWRPW